MRNKPQTFVSNFENIPGVTGVAVLSHKGEVVSVAGDLASCLSNNKSCFQQFIGLFEENNTTISASASTTTKLILGNRAFYTIKTTLNTLYATSRGEIDLGLIVGQTHFGCVVILHRNARRPSFIAGVVSEQLNTLRK